MNSYKNEGIVLKKNNLSETDQIVTLFTKDFGKISLLAKGVRRLTSRKRGCLEVFNQVKFFAIKTKGIDIVTEVDTIKNFFTCRKDLKKIAVAYEITEVVDKLSAEENEQSDLYFLLIECLLKIQQASLSDVGSVFDFFGKESLKILGYWPREQLFPAFFNVGDYIENIIEREIKSRKFLSKILYK